MMLWFKRGAAAALLLLLADGAGAAPLLTGDYVEARTCQVYTGACHANGEAVTEGREAILAWHVRDGKSRQGVALSGLNIVAVIAGSDNLASEQTPRRAVLYVDSRATDGQKKALAGTLMERYKQTLGQVVAVKAAPIEFARKGLEYTVRVPGIASVKTTRYACSLCVMPHAVWYPPFIALKSGLVAKSAVAEYRGAPEMDVRWYRAGENSSYVGEFTL